MKRKLALLMAFMMAATLVPAQPADAASKNHINRVATAVSSDMLDNHGSGTLITTDVILTLDKDNASVEGPKKGDVFELHLTGDAKWMYRDVLGNQYEDKNVPGLYHTAKDIENAKVQRMTDSVLRVEVQADGKVKVPMVVYLNGTPEGAQKVIVVPKDSNVTPGEYTYATVGASSIKYRVQKKEKISRSGNTKVQMILEEMTPSSFENGKAIKLKLPSGFSWDIKGPSKDPFKQPNNAAVSIEEKSDSRILVVTPNANITGKLDTIYVNIAIIPNRDARYGDVDVIVQENTDVSPSSLVVAEYVDYGVMVKADKVLNVIAGKDIEGLYKSKLTIEEPATSSLQGNRYMEFKFVDENGKEVKASLQHKETMKLDKKAGDPNVKLLIDSSSIESVDKRTEKTDKYEIKTYSEKDDKRANSFDLYVEDQSERTKVKYELEVPFVVESGFTGKLFLQVKGAGAEEQLVQIADVKAPVTFEVKGQLPQVKIGLQKQPGQDIAIKETEAAALQDYEPAGSANYAQYEIKTEENFNMFFKSVSYEKDGDIGIKKVSDDDKQIIVQVDRRSTKPSTITLKGITVTLDRTVPYGAIRLEGHFGVVDGRHKLSNNVKTFDYFTTVTPVSDEKRVTTVFTIGEKTFTEVIGGVKEEKTADVAPFIKDNRTMLPVRYVANAIGAIVNYDPTTRVATFTKNQMVVSINIDKDVMYVNGSPVKLYTKPANVEGRIFLPLSNVAQAFGLKQGGEDETIIWNQENKTVTILPQDANADEIKAAKEGKVGEDATMKEEKKEETKTEEKK